MDIALFTIVATVVALQLFIAAGVLLEAARLKAAGARVPALQLGKSAPSVPGLAYAPTTILLFVTPKCQRCLDVLAELTSSDLKDTTIVCHGTESTCVPLAASGLIATLHVDDDGSVAEVFGVSATPACVIIRDGVVVTHADLRDALHLRKLVARSGVGTDGADATPRRDVQPAVTNH